MYEGYCLLHCKNVFEGSVVLPFICPVARGLSAAVEMQ